MAETFEQLAPDRVQELAIDLAEMLGKLIFLGTLMAQELQEFVDDAEEAGSDLRSTKALIDDWNDFYKQVEHLE